MSSLAFADGGWQQVEPAVRAELSKRYGGARIEWASEPALNAVTRVEGRTENLVAIEAEPSPGVARFFATTGQSRVSGSIGFHAFVPTWVASRRLMPGETIKREDLSRQWIDVSTGLARESRGVLLPADAPIEHLEARQTLLEGGFVTSAAVRRAPDLRKGEPLKIRLQSGAIEVTAQGVAEESASQGETVRVQSLKTHRTLVGRLLEDGSVEVRL